MMQASYLKFIHLFCNYYYLAYICNPLQKQEHSKELYKKMANHKSALKRIRSNEAKRVRNKFQAKTTRSYVRRLRDTKDKAEAQELFKTVASMLDKLAKKNVIHKNKAANNKSKLARLVNSLA
jgi:small subunit ribosomal protein S20